MRRSTNYYNNREPRFNGPNFVRRDARGVAQNETAAPSGIYKNGTWYNYQRNRCPYSQYNNAPIEMQDSRGFNGEQYQQMKSRAPVYDYQGGYNYRPVPVLMPASISVVPNPQMEMPATSYALTPTYYFQPVTYQPIPVLHPSYEFQPMNNYQMPPEEEAPAEPEQATQPQALIYNNPENMSTSDITIESRDPNVIEIDISSAEQVYITRTPDKLVISMHKELNEPRQEMQISPVVEAPKFGEAQQTLESNASSLQLDQMETDSEGPQEFTSQFVEPPEASLTSTMEMPTSSINEPFLVEHLSQGAESFTFIDQEPEKTQNDHSQSFDQFRAPRRVIQPAINPIYVELQTSVQYTISRSTSNSNVGRAATLNRYSSNFPEQETTEAIPEDNTSSQDYQGENSTGNDGFQPMSETPSETFSSGPILPDSQGTGYIAPAYIESFKLPYPISRNCNAAVKDTLEVISVEKAEAEVPPEISPQITNIPKACQNEQVGQNKKEVDQNRKEPGQNIKEAGQNKKGGQNKNEGGQNKEVAIQYKGEAVQYKNETGQNKKEAGQYKNEGGQYKNERGQIKNEVGQFKNEGGQNKKEAGQNKGEAIQYKGEAAQYKYETGQNKKEAGQYKNEGGQYKNGARQNKKEALQYKNEGGQYKNAAGQYKNEVGQYKNEGAQNKKEAGQNKGEAIQYKGEAAQYKYETGQNKKEAGQYKNEGGQYKNGARQNKKESLQYKNETGQNKNAAGQYKNEGGQCRNEGGQYKNGADGNRKEAGQNKGEAVQNKGAAVQNKNEAVQNKNEAVPNKSEAVQNKNEAGQNKNEGGLNKGETGENKSDAFENKKEMGQNKNEVGENKNEVGENKNEVGENKKGAVVDKNEAGENKIDEPMQTDSSKSELAPKNVSRTRSKRKKSKLDLELEVVPIDTDAVKPFGNAQNCTTNKSEKKMAKSEMKMSKLERKVLRRHALAEKKAAENIVNTTEADENQAEAETETNMDTYPDLPPDLEAKLVILTDPTHRQKFVRIIRKITNL